MTDDGEMTHVCMTERARIEALDGRVEWRGCWRVLAGPSSRIHYHYLIAVA
jgi:hypothetical protein